jgi:hypothetical protein
MRFFNFLKIYLHPQSLLRFRSLNVIVAICIFVIFSFLLGTPIGHNMVRRNEKIYQDYNYQIFSQFPDNEAMGTVIRNLRNQECELVEGNELKCAQMEPVALYQQQIEFVVEGITKRVTFVIDMFDIRDVYLEVGDIKINYDPKLKFTLTEDDFQVEENVENYLIVFWSDALYFQAHPYGTDALKIDHNGKILKTATVKIFYQNNIPDFTLKSDIADNGPEFGAYLLEQIVQGHASTLKLKSYTLAFLVGVFYTLITVLVLWIFFRKNGKLKNVSEYYNLAAITSIPVFLIFFILLWFLPFLIDIFIFAFAAVYLLVIYRINTTEDLV